MPWLVPLARRPERVAPAAIASALCGLVALIAVLVPGAAFAATSTEPFADKQWGLRQIGAERAWDVSRGLGARVGIIDTGIDLGHGELAGRVVDSTRCIGTRGLASDCGGSAQDDRGHGTHVAGIVAAPVDGTGVAGVAPEASLLIVKALDADGSGESLDVVAGIDWLLSRDVHVLNLSLAQTGLVRGAQGSPIKAAVERASSLGVVVVLAAGNDEKATQHRVGSDLPAIVVGATGRNGLVAPYSQPLDGLVRWGLVAPGGDGSSEVEGDVISTYWFAGRRSTYAWSAGTSMATAHVSGVGALLAARGVRGQAAVDQMLATAAAAPCGSACRGVVDASSALGLGP
ncbi:MAG: S8 family serine peptidase, partial [Acidimicrobiales bacterium]